MEGVEPNLDTGRHNWTKARVQGEISRNPVEVVQGVRVGDEGGIPALGGIAALHPSERVPAVP